MLEPLTDLPPGIEGVRASGRVSKADYENVLEPMLEEAHRQDRRVRFLYEVPSSVEKFTVGAAWEDLRVGVQFLRLFEGCAVVSDLGWLRVAAQLVGFAMPCPLRAFAPDEREAAIAWLVALPEGPSVNVRVLPEAEVIVIEPQAALRAADFDAVAAAADAWIEAHGDLRGLVVRAREFPGWENLAGMMRHIRFVRDYQRRIRRIALATGSRLGGAAQAFADLFVAAELQLFPYGAIDDAIAWAGAPAPSRPVEVAGASELPAHP
jgi:hypothetical protein